MIISIYRNTEIKKDFKNFRDTQLCTKRSESTSVKCPIICGITLLIWPVQCGDKEEPKQAALIVLLRAGIYLLPALTRLIIITSKPCKVLLGSFWWLWSVRYDDDENLKHETWLSWKINGDLVCESVIVYVKIKIKCMRCLMCLFT